jgi:hypothetical protein
MLFVSSIPGANDGFPFCGPASPPLPGGRDQKWPQFGAWSEDAVEPREVCPR